MLPLLAFVETSDANNAGGAFAFAALDVDAFGELRNNVRNRDDFGRSDGANRRNETRQERLNDVATVERRFQRLRGRRAT